MKAKIKGFITTREAAAKWSISAQRVGQLCADGRVFGARRDGTHWLVPSDAPRPSDGRANKNCPPELRELVFRVDALKRDLESLCPLTDGEKRRLSESFLVDYTHNSTAIEGNTLTLSETAIVLGGVTIAQKSLKEHLEVIGHRDAFRYLEAATKANEAVSEKFVRELHSLVLADSPEDKGVWRRISVMIVGAVHTPSQPYLIPKLMEDWVREVNSSREHAVVLAAKSHLTFEAIHPFIDGNGRTGRLVANFIMMRRGFLPVSIKYDNRLAYYSAFTAYHERGDYVPMAKIFLEAECARLEEYLAIIRGGEPAEVTK